MINGIMDDRIALLLERWSHSEDVDRYVDYVYGKIKEAGNTLEWKKTEYPNLFVQSGKTDVTIFGIDLTLCFTVYFAFSHDAAKHAIERHNSGNSIDLDGKRLNIIVFVHNGEVVEAVSTPNIMHEIEHLLQISKGFKSKEDMHDIVNAAYHVAYSILIGGEYGEEEKAVARLVYISNPHEQDALMNEYYYQLMHHEQFVGVRGGATIDTLKKYEEDAEWFLGNMYEPWMDALITRYRAVGLNRSVFGSMVRNGLHRFKRKMRNVEKHFGAVSENITENRLSHGETTRYGSLRRL